MILRVENDIVARPKELQEFENKLDITFSFILGSPGRQSASLTIGDFSFLHSPEMVWFSWSIF